MQQQEREVNGKAAAHVVVVTAGRKARESLFWAGLQEFWGLHWADGVLHATWQELGGEGSEEGCREELEVSAGCLD